MRISKALRGLAVVLLAAAIMTPGQNANAATGSTNVTINFPDIIVLHYTSALTLTFTPALDTAVNDGATTPVGVALVSPATFNGALVPSAPAAAAFPQTLAVTVNNVWAIRGITASGNINVTGALTTPTATNAGSTATASAFVVSSGATGPLATISLPAPGFAATLGNIGFNLDTSAVTTAGAHTGMVYTVTAVAAP